MKHQSATIKFKNKWGKELTKKILYITRHGINMGQHAHQGSKECARRIANGQADTCYIHGGQYGRGSSIQ